MRAHVAFRFAAVAILVGVLVVSFLPGDSVDPYRLHVGDSVEVGHIAAYALLAAATLLSVAKQSRSAMIGLGIVVTISLLGMAVEFVQPLVGRTTSLVDFAENEIGIACGIAIFFSYLFFERLASRLR